MSYVRFDQQYKNLLQEVLYGEDSRLVVGRDKLKYYQIFGQDIKIDLREEFPALTLRSLPIKKLFKELMWDVTGGNNVNDLGTAKNFWDFLAKDDGYLPHSYGSSWRNWPTSIPSEPEQVKHGVFKQKAFDQLDWIVTRLFNNPVDRQLVLQTYNPSIDLKAMKIPPCHPCGVFSSDGCFLDLLMTARSNDFILGIPLDVFRYACLTHLVAKTAGLVPRYLKFSSANNHLYEYNVQDAELMLSREIEGLVPKLKIHNTKEFFHIFHVNPDTDLELLNYKPHPTIKVARPQ